MSTRRCETCGKFVPNSHLKTARHYYDIDHSLPVSVYSLATATKYQERLDCASCSMPCCRMTEATREFGSAVGRSLPNGWEKCSPTATQADYVEVPSC
jgi:hypothetical protein